MSYSDQLKARKSSYERDLANLKEVRMYLSNAKAEIKDDPIYSLVELLKNNLVIDDVYYEKEPIKIDYESLNNVYQQVEGYIISVEGKISSLEHEIRLAESREAAENANNS